MPATTEYVPLEPAVKWTDLNMDFVGQNAAEHLFTIILFLFTVVGFVAGFMLESIQLALLSVALGTVVALALAVPPWPMFRKHPVKWLPAPEKSKTETEENSPPKTTWEWILQWLV